MRLHRLAVSVCVGMMVCATGLAQEPTAEQPAAPPAPAWEDVVIAVVDGKPVTRKQVWWEMEQGWGGEVLDDLIVGMLMAAEAERQGVKVPGPEVDAELARIKAGYDSGLRRLISGKYDLHAIQVFSPQELDPPLRGDLRLVEDFVKSVRGEEASISTTTVFDSVYGHLIAFAADEAMTEHRVVEIEDLKPEG